MIKKLKLRTTLIFLQLLAFIPFIIIFIHASIREAQNLLEQKRHDILNEISFVVKSENSVGTIYFLLRTLSADPSIKKFDKKEIQEHFESILQSTPLFHNIALLDKDGYGLISGKKIDKLPSASDRLYFKRVLKNKDFVWGEFAISRTTGKPTIHFAIPVLDNYNNILSVIVAEPIMEQVLPKYDKLEYPTLILDANGVIVKSKDNQRVGEKYELYEKITKDDKDKGFLKLRDHYLFFSKLNINNGHLLTLVMDVPLSIMSVLADSGFFYEVFIIFSIFLFLLYLTNKVSNNLIIKPLKTVQEALRSFTGDTPLQKIEQEFPSDFEIFRDIYNTFIDNIKEKKQRVRARKKFLAQSF